MAEVVLQYPQILQRRTWYGITATVNLKSKLMHKAGYGNFLVPHPAAVNWLLRRGLKTENAISLSIHHEFGHLQTVPFVLLYAGILLSMSFGEGALSWFKIFFLAVSTQAVWEILSEFFTLFNDIEGYRTCYDGVKILPRVIFWLSSCLLALAGAFILVH
ncbi:MAG: hypothetical protein WBN03_21645 [Desulfobacterales bacterium]